MYAIINNNPTIATTKSTTDKAVLPSYLISDVQATITMITKINPKNANIFTVYLLSIIKKQYHFYKPIGLCHDMILLFPNFAMNYLFAW